MLDSINGMIDSIRKDKTYQLDVDSMNAYFDAYGLDKNSLSFNLLFPPAIDLHYVQ